jgi:cobalt-zinc-cadmium efflux system membrane fusion protein
MNRTVLYVSAAAIAAVLATWLSAGGAAGSLAAQREGRHGHHDDQMPTGAHGGRLLEEGGFALEIVIAESGIPPEFRIYGYRDDEPLSADAFEATIRLERLGGAVDTFEFAAEEAYRRGLGVVREPHSFDVFVTARHGGVEYEWHYDSHEGRTVIPERVAETAGIVTDVAGPRSLAATIELTGTVEVDPGRVSQVRPRFPGLVTAVLATAGDSVEKGDLLARVETNESLRPIDVVAPISGLVVDRNVQVGQVTGDSAMFVVTNHDVVWVQLNVFGKDLDRVRSGQDVALSGLDGGEFEGRIEWVSPLVAHASQSVRARVPIDNPDGKLRVGQFVRARVVVDEEEVPLAVMRSGLQTFRDFDVVFEKIGDAYEVRMLKLGRADDKYVEVLSGLEPGAAYVSQNSYLIKADIEKSGASHDH